MVTLLKRHADGSLRCTYLEGRALNDVDDTARVPSVGLTYLAGTDKSKVNRLKEDFMDNREPDQKDAARRFNTAGALLLQLDVARDLSIMQTDYTFRAKTGVDSERSTGCGHDRQCACKNRQ
ncbi:hypothetical protein N7G274_006853 [Stereocaulon virgatum]|uniref:Uncharacterized protein n=1 Tax=Stereocaulon virgatum TaxID=373712 RepID=A0ABR4A5R6_9LECA